ncbi:MAG: hypothetical protein HZA53_07405 [Planctomycetes bacterium]|nr:hypothetical protein [Planctomycetota bacterium]
MRFSSAISLGLGLVIVLPAVSAPQRTGELEHALSETVRALAVLTGLEKDLRSRPPVQTVELVRSATEPAVGDERSRDEQLQYLRKDVGRLQMAFDELAQGAHMPIDPDAPTKREELGAVPSVTITTGLDDRLRAQLSSGVDAPFVRRDTTARSGAAMPSSAPRDSAADALRQGQALLRAGKAKDALIVLRGVETDVRAKYWMARAFEKLGRVEEAIDLYQAVVKDESAGYLVQRARNDAEFLEWKRTFAKKLDKDADAKTPAAGAQPSEGAKAPAPAAKPVEAPKSAATHEGGA